MGQAKQKKDRFFLFFSLCVCVCFYKNIFSATLHCGWNGRSRLNHLNSAAPAAAAHRNLMTLIITILLFLFLYKFRLQL